MSEESITFKPVNWEGEYNHRQEFDNLGFYLENLSVMKPMDLCRFEEEIQQHWAYYYTLVFEFKGEDCKAGNLAPNDIIELLDYIQLVVRQKKRGWVYVAQNLDEPELYKIGMSKRPIRRVKTMGRCGLGYKPTLELIHVIRSDNASKLEKRIHFNLISYRSHAEWFELDERILDWLKSYSYANAPD